MNSTVPSLQVEVEKVSLPSSLVSRAAWALAETLQHTDQVHNGLVMYLPETLGYQLGTCT